MAKETIRREDIGRSRVEDLAGNAGARMHPPTVQVARSGGRPAEPDLAEKARAERERASDDLAKMRADRRAAKPEQRERFDKAIGEKQDQIRRLSDRIREEESRR